MGLIWLWRHRLQARAATGTARSSASIPLDPEFQFFDDLPIPPDKGGDPADTSNDADMERARPMHRVVYDNRAWRQHRDGRRVFRAALGLIKSRIMTRLSFEVSIIAALATLLCILQTSRWGLRWLSLPSSIFSLSAPSLGLLLVFRTNASYSRWEETRRLFGQAAIRCQELARKALYRLGPQPQQLTQFLRYTQAFPFALKVHVRGGPGGCENDDNLVEDLRGILTRKELELLLTSHHRPNHILQCLTGILKASDLDMAGSITMDHCLSVLADIVGGCDRLRSTPIPLSYTSLTTRFLVLWLVLLPLALSTDIVRGGHAIWLTIPAVSFIAFLLLGIEEVGVQIEEPFTILPLEAIAESGRENILAMVQEHEATLAMTRGKQVTIAR